MSTDHGLRLIPRADPPRPDRGGRVVVIPPLGATPSTVDAHAVVDDTLPRPRRHLARQVLGLPGLLLGADAVALLGGYAVVRPPWSQAVLFAALLIAARSAARAYRPRITLSALDDLPRWLTSVLVALGLTLALDAVVDANPADDHAILMYGLTVVGVSVVLGVLAQAGTRAVRRRRGPRDRTLIVGTGPVGRLIGQTLLTSPQLGLHPVGYIDQLDQADAGRRAVELPVPVVAERVQDLADSIARYGVSTVILAFDAMPGSQAVDTIIAAHQQGSAVLVVPQVSDLHHDGPDVDRVSGVPLVRLRPDPTLRFSWWVKRAVDVLAGAVSLLLLSPLLGLLAVAVLVDSGRPVLFWQQRIGLDGRPFQLCKFRSMRPVSDSESQATWSIAQDPRVSRIGRFLRASSLDEVPQLWNVVRGDMSLVGPRPERPTFVQQFTDEHERYWARHRVPVGLTGLAQVNGLRGDTSIADRARFDNYYIANWSLWLDVKITMLTVREVLRGSGG